MEILTDLSQHHVTVGDVVMWTVMVYAFRLGLGKLVEWF